MKTPRFLTLTVIVAGLWTTSFVVFVVHPSMATQLLSMLLGLGLLVAGCVGFVRLFRHWERERWREVLPPVACVLVVVLMPETGAAARRAVFQHSLPGFESVIHQIEQGTIPVTIELQPIPQARSGSGGPVLAQRSTNGVLTVEFITGGGFPVKHSGFLYCSSGSIEAGSRTDSRWPRRQPIKPRWYRVSD